MRDELFMLGRQRDGAGYPCSFVRELQGIIRFRTFTRKEGFQNLISLEQVEPAQTLLVDIFMQHLHRSFIRTGVPVLQNVNIRHQVNGITVAAMSRSKPTSFPGDSPSRSGGRRTGVRDPD